MKTALVLSKKNPQINYLVAMIIAVIADGIDIPTAVLQVFPGAPQVIDGIVLAILFALAGPFVLVVGWIDFIPGVGLLPFLTGATALAWNRAHKKGYK